jgi:hypothetical protein
MPISTKRKGVVPPAGPHARRAKFQADLAPAEDRAVRALKEDLRLSGNTDLLPDAVALYRWAVSERKQGHRIVRERADGERRILVFPRFERVAPEGALPSVRIEWTPRELERLAERRGLQCSSSALPGSSPRNLDDPLSRRVWRSFIIRFAGSFRGGQDKGVTYRQITAPTQP